MAKLNNSIINLVNNKYSDTQKVQVAELLRKKEVTVQTGYNVLAIGLQEIIRELSIRELESYYGTYYSNLNDLDKTIAQILISLTDVTGEDVKLSFEKSIRLSQTAPEQDYLASMVCKYLDGEFN